MPATNEGELVLYGLGSCVGILFYCPECKYGAGAHVMMPTDDPIGVQSDRIIQEALTSLLVLPVQVEKMDTYLIGGADIMSLPSISIGTKNITYARQVLKQQGIATWYEDTGGTKARSVSLNPENGILTIKSNGNTVVLNKMNYVKECINR